MTQYKKEFKFPALFPPISQDNVLAEWLAKKGLSQFHCAGNFAFLKGRGRGGARGYMVEWDDEDSHWALLATPRVL